MSSVSHFFYWASLVIIVYTYAGYGFIMALIAASRRKLVKPDNESGYHLPLTVVIPAFNEAPVIGAKIRNTLQLNYPRQLFQVLVITDGSTDGTDQIAAAFPQVTVMHDPIRKGKAAAINRAMTAVDSELVVLTDANTLIDPESLRLLSAHYRDEKVGGVSGEKKVVSSDASDLSSEGEGLYWKYESLLKKLDARAGTIVGAAGELFSFRAKLFEPLEEDTILDDFVLSLRICLKGYRVAYEPAASALETGSISIPEEEKRKIRICAGGFQAIKRMPGLFEFSKHPMLTFQYISHRVFRWTFAPVSLILILFTNVILVINDAGSWYRFTLVLQVIAYSAALAGWIGARNNRKLPLVYIPYYFLFMNWSVFTGFYRFLRKKQSGAWEKANRLTIPVN
ncbi:glycosyltransferase family 2 protein [Flavihumibacter solisilvae]|uniref:Glycosyl transferase n=1 Tax=Flavihumibacter solisilvae TaxID=1349421 RepID=A0A0C1LKH8_9BACT|nr:glycosyltransferase family 2 protein [Flavihumibacter solisilvae]KIC95868.1 glycosyl transferase [Flavihumibacter solisilvae]